MVNKYCPTSWLPKEKQQFIIIKELPDGGKVGTVVDSDIVNLLKIGFHTYLPYLLIRDGFITNYKK